MTAAIDERNTNKDYILTKFSRLGILAAAVTSIITTAAALSGLALWLSSVEASDIHFRQSLFHTKDCETLRTTTSDRCRPVTSRFDAAQRQQSQQQEDD